VSEWWRSCIRVEVLVVRLKKDYFAETVFREKEIEFE
jgi:hypothetical protein